MSSFKEKMGRAPQRRFIVPPPLPPWGEIVATMRMRYPGWREDDPGMVSAYVDITVDGENVRHHFQNRGQYDRLMAGEMEDVPVFYACRHRASTQVTP